MRLSFPFRIFCLLACLLCPLEIPAAPADTPLPQAAACFSQGWPWEHGDLKPDPALVFGHLDNGLRYVLMENREPKGRVAIYLNVQAGSAYENEEQRGVAHFLEHMLFNGSTHYPPGTLVNYLQSIGMQLGADSNAYTSHGETVYNLILPSGDAKSLEEGFLVLSDYARGALLAEQEVDRERGVILAEKRTGDSAADRVMEARMRFDFAGTRIAERDPIGREEVIRKTDSALLRSFYDHWYRPENMIVVVVGDMDVKEAEQRLTARFSSLKGAGPAGPCPDLGQIKEDSASALLLPEPELGYTGLSLATVFNIPPGPDTVTRQEEELRRYMALTLLNQRLQRVEQGPDSTLSQPKAFHGVLLQRFGYAELNARIEPDNWRNGLALLQQTLAQALDYGFSEAELNRAKKKILAELDRAVQTMASRQSRDIAGDIIHSLNNNKVFLSPLQERDLYAPMLERLTSEEAQAALRWLWDHPRRLIRIAGITPQEKLKEPEAMILWAFRSNEAESPPRWREEKVSDFPYLPQPPEAATIEQQAVHKAIGVETSILAGGVTLNCKTTDFQRGQVLLSARFGTGRQGEPSAGLSPLAEALMRESGVGRLDREQLNEALAGSTVRLDFSVEPESFAFTGSALPGELPLLLELLRHRLLDPAFRPEDFRRAREKLQRFYQQMDSTVEGALEIQGMTFLTAASPEYASPSWEQVAGLKLEQTRDWLAPAFIQAPLEINIVGDIAPEKALALTRRVFGGEHRAETTKPQPQAVRFPAGKEKLIHLPSSIDKAGLTVAWVSNDFWDIGRNRRLNLLASVFNDRLRVKLREELGAAYSPQAFSHPSRIHPDFGLFAANLTVAPEQAASLAGVIKEVAEALRGQGVSADELRRALKPTLTSIRDMKRNNRYWLETVLSLSSRHPEQLRWPETISEDFAAITKEELSALAVQYLRKNKAATVIISPASTGGEKRPQNSETF